MRNWIKITIGAALLCCIGCGPKYPLDIPEEKWETMSTAEQLRAREKHAEVEKAREERRAAEAKAREAEAIEWLKRQEAARDEAQYGERVQCILSNAKVYRWGEWHRIDPIALDIVQGMVLAFEMHAADPDELRLREQGYAGFDGQTLSLCAEKDQVQRNAQDCAKAMGTFKQFARGLTQRIASEDFLRGDIRCDFAPGEGMPKRLILERSE
ncbi:MAG: hypothetical protein ACQESV_03355 [Thermodesulfobacteriota bacterium]